MTEENTEKRNAEHIGAHGRALSKLWAAFAAYQEWQEDQGDVDTFVSWVKDELPGLFPARARIALKRTSRN